MVKCLTHEENGRCRACALEITQLRWNMELHGQSAIRPKTEPYAGGS